MPGATRESFDAALKNIGASGKKKFKTVMHEYGKRRLKSSDGSPVTDPKQAAAIALSEGKRHHEKMERTKKTSRF